MGRQPAKSVVDKARIVLAVLGGEVAIAGAARREGASEVSVSKWRDQFLAGGWQALEACAGRGRSARERRLAAEAEQLDTALGEARMELRLWKKRELAVWAFDEIEALRRQAGVTVTGFCEVAGIPRAGWYRRRPRTPSRPRPRSQPLAGRAGCRKPAAVGRARYRQYRAGPGVGLDNVSGAGPQRAGASGKPRRRGPPPSRGVQRGAHRPAHKAQPPAAGRHLASSRPAAPGPGTRAVSWTAGPRRTPPARSPPPTPPRMPSGSSMLPWPRPRTSSTPKTFQPTNTHSTK